MSFSAIAQDDGGCSRVTRGIATARVPTATGSRLLQALSRVDLCRRRHVTDAYREGLPRRGHATLRAQPRGVLDRSPLSAHLVKTPLLATSLRGIVATARRGRSCRPARLAAAAYPLTYWDLDDPGGERAHLRALPQPRRARCEWMTSRDRRDEVIATFRRVRPDSREITQSEAGAGRHRDGTRAWSSPSEVDRVAQGAHPGGLPSPRQRSRTARRRPLRRDDVAASDRPAKARGVPAPSTTRRGIVFRRAAYRALPLQALHPWNGATARRWRDDQYR